MVKVTVPVGVPVPEAAATAAVNVTLWPTFEGLADELSVVWLARGAAMAGVSTTSSPPSAA